VKHSKTGRKNEKFPRSKKPHTRAKRGKASEGSSEEEEGTDNSRMWCECWQNCFQITRKADCIQCPKCGKWLHETSHVWSFVTLVEGIQENEHEKGGGGEQWRGMRYPLHILGTDGQSVLFFLYNHITFSFKFCKTVNVNKKLFSQ